MSATKHLHKYLPTMNTEQRASFKARLEAALLTQRNPMVRSSVREQLAIIDRWEKAQCEYSVPVNPAR